MILQVHIFSSSLFFWRIIKEIGTYLLYYVVTYRFFLKKGDCHKVKKFLKCQKCNAKTIILSSSLFLKDTHMTRTPYHIWKFQNMDLICKCKKSKFARIIQRLCNSNSNHWAPKHPTAQTCFNRAWTLIFRVLNSSLDPWAITTFRMFSSNLKSSFLRSVEGLLEWYCL